MSYLLALRYTFNIRCIYFFAITTSYVSPVKNLFAGKQWQTLFNSRSKWYQHSQKGSLAEAKFSTVHAKVAELLRRVAIRSADRIHSPPDADDVLRDVFQINPQVLRQIEQCLEEIKVLKETLLELEPLAAGVDMEELKSLAKDELQEIDMKKMKIERKILALLMPDQTADIKIVLEVTPGVGGQEAMLFASDILNMYVNFIGQIPHWEILELTTDKSELGGLCRGSLIASGHKIYQELKYEAGIHRVQRVPKTEKSGRIHTSTVAVTVLPQLSDIVVSVKAKDLKVECMRASGPGGQHVNKTNSAVRITHIPTGTVVENQTDRSQLRNKELALQRLRGLLYEKKFEQQIKVNQTNRKLQVGTSARSEKIRTYNFLQDRVTDHRINFTLHNLTEFLSGGTPLQMMMDSLQSVAEQENLDILLDNSIRDTK